MLILDTSRSDCNPRVVGVSRHYLDYIQKVMDGRISRSRDSIQTLLLKASKNEANICLSTGDTGSALDEASSAAPACTTSGDDDGDGGGDPDSDRRKSSSPSLSSHPPHSSCSSPAESSNSFSPGSHRSKDPDTRSRRRDWIALLMFLTLVSVGVGLASCEIYVLAGVLWRHGFKCVVEALKP